MLFFVQLCPNIVHVCTPSGSGQVTVQQFERVMGFQDNPIIRRLFYLMDTHDTGRIQFREYALSVVSFVVFYWVLSCCFVFILVILVHGFPRRHINSIYDKWYLITRGVCCINLIGYICSVVIGVCCQICSICWGLNRFVLGLGLLASDNDSDRDSIVRLAFRMFDVRETGLVPLDVLRGLFRSYLPEVRLA